MDPRNYNVKWDTPVGPQAQAERNDVYATYIQHGKRQHVKITQVLVLIFMFFFSPFHGAGAYFFLIGCMLLGLMEEPQLFEEVSEKGPQVHRIVSCEGCDDHLQTKPGLTRDH